MADFRSSKSPAGKAAVPVAKAGTLVRSDTAQAQARLKAPKDVATVAQHRVDPAVQNPEVRARQKALKDRLAILADEKRRLQMIILRKEGEIMAEETTFRAGTSRSPVGASLLRLVGMFTFLQREAAKAIAETGFRGYMAARRELLDKFRSDLATIDAEIRSIMREIDQLRN